MKNFLFILFAFFVLPALHAQQTVRGIVQDNEGLPLIGATVMVKGSNNGTATDVDGKYELKAKPVDVLVFSYTGYEPQEITVGSQTSLDVVLNTDVEVLDKVVVIGYGSVRKRDLTGAVNTLDPTTEEVSQFDDFQSYLQGRATGVYVQSNGAEPNSPSSIRIRGANSLRGDNEPLYVIDGIIVNSSTEDTADPLSGGNSYLSPQNGLTGVNPQDIESIEILKDASATAIYGSRGANGVILITTKQGTSGKTKVTYNTVARFGEATNLVDFLDASQYVDYQAEARELQGFNPRFYQYSDGSIAEFVTSADYMEANAADIPRLEQVNWYEDIFRTSVSQNHRLNVSGGSEKGKFYFAGGYLTNQGIVPNAEAKSGDILLNFTRDLSDRVSLSTRVSATFSANQASKGTENLGGANRSIIQQITLGAPLLGFSDNNVTDDIEQIVDGPRAWIQDYNDDAEELRTLGSIKLDYEISDVFSYRFQTGVDYRNKQRQIWYGTSIFRGAQANGEAGISTLDRFRYNIDNTLMFKKRFRKGHRINGTVGFIWDATDVEQTTFSASDFANKDLRYNGISLGQVYTPLVYDTRQEALLSFLGRVNYSWKDRYLVTASFRSDGTSKFADDNKYSFFPAVAVAWRMINEKFLADQNLLSDAKLRIGWGLTGSQAIQPYQTLARFGPTANLLSDAEGNGITALIPLNLANPSLIWETTNQFNAGVDVGFLNDRFTGSVDVYYKRTYDLLQQLNIGPSAGFSSFTANQGDLINRGIEFGFNANILEGKLRWQLRGNISFNRNEITNLGLPPAQFGTQTYSAFLGQNVSGGNFFKVPANIFIEGQPAGVFWGYATNGIVSTPEQLEQAPNVQGMTTQLGDVFYVDQNGDGNITELDLTVIGDPNPDFTYGIGSDFGYGRFSLSLFFNGVYGNEIANGNLAQTDYAGGNTNNIRTEAYLDAWRPDNIEGAYPRIGYLNPGDFTDRFLEDGSFLRLSYVSLGYELPAGVINRIQSARFFVSGQNLLLITSYSGFDPEVDSFSYDPTRRGIDWGSFPNQRSVTFGLNVGF
ncbi:SusC/RagA family TonB-linked outer membrane protein [Lewinella sp. LCG006]|uniref:SusC/RagA family TonB-linked outer membrane protein n=1 Tax=Lewinella sp. LCG006 TaxID=3231911 RepID=UPI0034615909